MAWVKTKTTASGQKRYKVQYHGPDDRTHSKTFLRSEDARAFARSVETAKRQGDYMDPSRARTRVREYWPRFMASSPNLRQTTRDLYDGLARNHVLPILGDHRLSRLTVGDVNTFVASMEERGARPPTINARFGSFEPCCRLPKQKGSSCETPPGRLAGIDEERAFAYPRSSATKCASLNQPKFISSPTPSRIATARWSCSSASAGLRVGEALALRVSDIELLRRRATNTRTLTELSGGRLPVRGTEDVRQPATPGAAGLHLRGARRSPCHVPSGPRGLAVHLSERRTRPAELFQGP